MLDRTNNNCSANITFQFTKSICLALGYRNVDFSYFNLSKKLPFSACSDSNPGVLEPKGMLG